MFSRATPRTAGSESTARRVDTKVGVKSEKKISVEK